MTKPQETIQKINEFNKFVDEERNLGRCTVLEASLAKLKFAVDSFIELHEPQGWEHDEYGYMARVNN